MRKPRPYIQQPATENHRFISLTKNQVAIVDASDFQWLDKFSWHAVSAVFKNRRSAWYAFAQIDKRYVSMARFILGLECGDPRIAEHRNHNSLDNRRENLRIVTQAENLKNKSKNFDNQSGYKGIVRQGNRWRAQITNDGVRIVLGSFLSREQAALAYDKAARIYHGEFACTNFNNEDATPKEIQLPELIQGTLFS